MRHVLAVLLLLAAAVLLGLGVMNEQPGLVWVALGLSIMAGLLVVLPRLAGALRRPGSGGPVDESSPADQAGPTGEPETAVFQPGKLTFHRARCPELGDTSTVSGLRSELVAAGMKPCPHCLPAVH